MNGTSGKPEKEKLSLPLFLQYKKIPTKGKEASPAACQGHGNIEEILAKFQDKSNLGQHRPKIKRTSQHLEVQWQNRSKNGEHSQYRPKNYVHKNT